MHGAALMGRSMGFIIKEFFPMRTALTAAAAAFMFAGLAQAQVTSPDATMPPSPTATPLPAPTATPDATATPDTGTTGTTGAGEATPAPAPDTTATPTPDGSETKATKKKRSKPE